MINIIAAVSKNGVIGSNGKIPWNIPEDMKFFKKMTTGNVVIMGRKTFESIGKALPERFNIVVSSSKESFQGAVSSKSFKQAVTLAKTYAKENNCEIFIIGGETIYRQGLEYADRLYITRVDGNFDGDACFPHFENLKEHIKDGAQIFVNTQTAGGTAVC